MIVKFADTFFGPNGSRYRKGVCTDFPDEFASKLPRSAKVLQAPPEVEKPKEVSLRDLDTERAGQDVLAARLAKAEAFRLEQEADAAEEKAAKAKGFAKAPAVAAAEAARAAAFAARAAITQE